MKQLIKLLVVIGGLATATAAQAACELGTFTDESTYALPGCPADVKEMVARIYACVRREDEETHSKELRCNSYLADYNALARKYNKDAAVTHVLIKAFPIQE